MSEKRLNNTIYIMYLVTENYKKAHSLTTEQFLDLDQKYNIINFVGECPDIFDSMNKNEMIEEIDQYVANYQRCALPRYRREIPKDRCPERPE